MSILDSDVLLALISSTEDEQVAEWVKQFPSRPQTTALSVAEVTAAIHSASHPLKHFAQERALEVLLDGLFNRRVLPLDVECAALLAKLSTAKTPEGVHYPLGVLIQAAISLRFRMPLVTGRPRDYLGLDLELHQLVLDTSSNPEASGATFEADSPGAGAS
ncbi:hypothetical protein [Arthrobacter sp. H20]|uniref:hypothetical protein n=1 Tax=Arthrobacter sp. H20 TaxID=1267981 RepID=UPI00047D821A|nr:hypothetical protein [Arthrobacter sp. H20]